MSLVKAQEKRGNAPGSAICTNRTAVVGVSDDGSMTGSRRSATVLEGIVDQGDAPACIDCGSVTQRSGSCYCCMNCGSTSSGCS